MWRVESIEVLPEGAVSILRREARRAKREQWERMRLVTVTDLFWQDLSAFRAILSRRNTPKEAAPGPPQPFLDDLIESNDEIGALLRFAQANDWKPLLVEFAWGASKEFANRLRQVAKYSKLQLHFYRLTGNWTIIDVDAKDASKESDDELLKSMGIQS